MSESVTEPDPATLGSSASHQGRRLASYTDILKSSAVIGGSSLLVVLIGVVRVKCMALLIGPAGVGLVGALTAIADLARSLAEMGVSRSGVRQIASAVGSNDQRVVATTVHVVRRTALALALLGAVAMLLLAKPVAVLTFGSDEHTLAVGALSLAVLFGVLGMGYAALLQGMRLIAEQAKVAIAGALLGTMAAVALVYVYRQDGVVISIVATAGLSALVGWWYCRRIGGWTARHAGLRLRAETVSLLRLGVAFMLSGILVASAAYAVRMLVIRAQGLEAGGYYHAAWTLGGLYLSFILQAIGTDFYPRLVARIGDHAACNQMVNQQTHVSVLLAGPGIIATLVLAPLLVAGFYSSSFVAAVDVLRWLCLGMAMRVITWPLGYIVVAKNLQITFVAIDMAWTVVNVALSWWLIERFGLQGAGMAFFGSYLFYTLLVYPIVRCITDFAWSRQNLHEIGLLALMITAAFLASTLLPPTAALVAGVSVMTLSVIHSLLRLSALLDTSELPRVVVRLARLFSPGRSGNVQSR